MTGQCVKITNASVIPWIRSRSGNCSLRLFKCVRTHQRLHLRHEVLKGGAFFEYLAPELCDSCHMLAVKFLNMFKVKLTAVKCHKSLQCEYGTQILDCVFTLSWA